MNNGANDNIRNGGLKMYEFKEDFRVGIDFIDDEHRRLFEIADKAYNVLMDEFIPDKYDYIVEIINELKNYAATHFKHEEEYMESIKYRRLLSQKVMHNDFLEALDKYNIYDLDNENQKEVIMEILNLLNDWLINHIYKADMLIGK